MCAYKYYISASTGIANLNSNSSDFSSVHAFCIEQNVSSEEVQPKKKKNSKNESKIIIRQEQQREHKKLHSEKLAHAACQKRVKQKNVKKKNQKNSRTFILHAFASTNQRYLTISSLLHTVHSIANYPTVNMRCRPLSHTPLPILNVSTRCRLL